MKLSIRKGRGKGLTKDRGKHFQMKEENEKISFNFYKSVFVLVITDANTTIQLLKQVTLFLLLFFKFYFF